MVGFEIPRDEQNGSFSADKVARTLRLMTTEDEGRIYRDRSREMGKIVADKDLHQRHFDTSIQQLENFKSNVPKA